MLIRWFGAEGMAARIREHIRMARAFASWVEADPDWELLAPVPLATICFRFRPAALREEAERAGSPVIAAVRPGEVPREAGAGGPEAGDAGRIDGLNERIMEAVNRSGEVFLSHTRLADRYTIRVSVGNPRTEMRHIETCWRLLREAAARALAEIR